MTHSGKPCDKPGEHRRRGYCTNPAASSVNHRRRTTTCVTLTFNVIPALGKDFSLVREKAEALDGQRRRKLLCCTRRERREPWTSYHRQRYPFILSLSPPLICRHNVLPSCDIFQLHWSVTLLLCSNTKGGKVIPSIDHGAPNIISTALNSLYLMRRNRSTSCEYRVRFKTYCWVEGLQVCFKSWFALKSTDRLQVSMLWQVFTWGVVV